MIALTPTLHKSRIRPPFAERLTAVLWSVPLLFVSASLGAWDSAPLPLAAVLERMEQTRETLQDVQFVYEGWIEPGSLAQKKVAGRVSARRPHYLRIVQRLPERQEIVSDGKKVWIYSPSLRQQLVGDWKAWLRHTHLPLPLLTWMETLSQQERAGRYEIHEGGYENHLYRLIYHAVHPEDASFTMWISEDTFLPIRGRMDTVNVTDVSIRDLQTNQGLETSLFDPSVPEGIAVISVAL